MVDWISTGSYLTAVGAMAFAALTYWESRKQRQLLETMVKAFPYVARSRRKARRTGPGRPQGSPQLVTPPGAPPVIDPVRAGAEERRRLKLELEREKLQWRKSRDIAKTIAWVLDRIDEGEDENNEE